MLPQVTSAVVTVDQLVLQLDNSIIDHDDMSNRLDIIYDMVKAFNDEFVYAKSLLPPNHTEKEVATLKSYTNNMFMSCIVSNISLNQSLQSVEDVNSFTEFIANLEDYETSCGDNSTFVVSFRTIFSVCNEMKYNNTKNIIVIDVLKSLIDYIAHSDLSLYFRCGDRISICSRLNKIYRSLSESSDNLIMSGMKYLNESVSVPIAELLGESNLDMASNTVALLLEERGYGNMGEAIKESINNSKGEIPITAIRNLCLTAIKNTDDITEIAQEMMDMLNIGDDTVANVVGGLTSTIKSKSEELSKM